MSDRERIAAAALFIDGVVWTLPPPVRHHHLIYVFMEAHRVRPGADGSPVRVRLRDQGFVTSTGRFVDREEAANIARAAGQTTATDRLLLTEHVW